jgi:hypothetical protein
MTVYRTLLVINNAGKTKDELNTLAAKDGIGLNGCVRVTPWECADQTLRDCNNKPELLKYWNKETRGVHESHVLEPKPVAAPPLPAAAADGGGAAGVNVPAGPAADIASWEERCVSFYIRHSHNVTVLHPQELFFSFPCAFTHITNLQPPTSTTYH